MELSHRAATFADLAIVCTFATSAEELFYCFPKARFPLTEAQLEQAVRERAGATVVELDGDVVGFADFYRWQHGGACAIGNVMVAPQARGRGVGRYLIQQMVVLATSRYQAREVQVSCFNQNLAGLLFYPRLGFEPYGLEPRTAPDGTPVALIHFRWLP
ncbi:GNAT family N-acetyltransferase [Zobellella sp. DQSA1]|uniref:GNAT family N-acetyltransferase n=1 Tax=Zobellella sp. DQSA1 TaxID=3342386 RepID=UPI0035C0AA67